MVGSTALVHAASQSFRVKDKSAQTGMLMSLTDDPNEAEPATIDSASSILGILTPNEESFDQQPGEQAIRTDGVTDALVSTLKGDIKVGDRIGASSIKGVGAKFSGKGWIVGIAQGTLTRNNKNAVRSTVKDSDGRQQNVTVDRIQVLVKPTYYNDTNQSPEDKSASVETIQRLADSVAGKRVKPIALILAGILLVSGLFLAGILVISAVRGGMQGIARQPLAKSVIIRQVLKAFLFAAGILLFVYIAALLVLKLL